jgi:hypothetical protein
MFDDSLYSLSDDDNDYLATKMSFFLANYSNMSFAEFIKNSIEEMLPFMNTNGSDHFII